MADPEKPDETQTEDQPDAAALKAQLDSQAALMERLQKDNERLFSFIEENIKKPAAAPTPAKEEEPDEELSIAETVANEDREGFAKLVRREAKKLLKETGYLKKDEAEKIVAERLQSQTADAQGQAQLKEKYPELLDPKSDLRLETERQFQEISAHPLYAGLTDLAKAWLAAERAELQLLKAGKRAAAKKETEAERFSRIAQQQGRTDSRASSSRDTEDGLTDEQRDFISVYGKVYGVTAEDYKKSMAASRSRRR